MMQPPTSVEPPNPTIAKPVSEPLSYSFLFKENLYSFARDVLVPLRIILSTFLIAIAFLLSESLLFAFVEWAATPQFKDFPVLKTFLDGVKIILTFVSFSFFFVAGISNIRLQWRINRLIEERALDE